MIEYDKYSEYHLEQAIIDADTKNIDEFLSHCNRLEDSYFFDRLMLDSTEHGSIPVIELLLEKYSGDVNVTMSSLSLSPILISARYDQLDTFIYLLEHGANPLNRDLLGRTFFHHVKSLSKIQKWIRSYDGQEYLYSKFPELYVLTPNYYLQHTGITEKYGFLKSCSDLNLL